jgi:glycosyltransferase involved in cell wall biosynthesis
MKILHLVSSGGLFGAEKVILNLAAQNNGIPTWVGALKNEHNPHLEVIEEAQKLGLKTVVFDSKGKADLKTVRNIRSFLAKESIDILHTHNYKSDILGFLATRFNKTKWVGTNHVWHSTDEKLRFYEKLDAFVLKSAKLIFTVSQEIKDDLIKKGFPAKKLHVISNGIPIQQFDQSSQRQNLRNSWKVSDSDILLGIIGRLAPEKGHEVLFKALQQLISRYPSVKCLVVGDGPLREDLENLTKKMSLSSHVIFTGIRKDIADIYHACDIMINASFIEGMPMTILEAMASHLPIIATKVGGVPQVIDDHKNGILLEAGQPDQLANAIEELVSNPGLRKLLAQKAYQDVCNQFSDKRMAKDYQRYYEILV